MKVLILSVLTLFTVATASAKDVIIAEGCLQEKSVVSPIIFNTKNRTLSIYLPALDVFGSIALFKFISTPLSAVKAYDFENPIELTSTDSNRTQSEQFKRFIVFGTKNSFYLSDKFPSRSARGKSVFCEAYYLGALSKNQEL